MIIASYNDSQCPMQLINVIKLTSNFELTPAWIQVFKCLMAMNDGALKSKIISTLIKMNKMWVNGMDTWVWFMIKDLELEIFHNINHKTDSNEFQWENRTS